MLKVLKQINNIAGWLLLPFAIFTVATAEVVEWYLWVLFAIIAFYSNWFLALCSLRLGLTLVFNAKDGHAALSELVELLERHKRA